MGGEKGRGKEGKEGSEGERGRGGSPYQGSQRKRQGESRERTNQLTSSRRTDKGCNKTPTQGKREGWREGGREGVRAREGEVRRFHLVEEHGEGLQQDPNGGQHREHPRQEAGDGEQVPRVLAQGGRRDGHGCCRHWGHQGLKLQPLAQRLLNRQHTEASIQCIIEPTPKLQGHTAGTPVPGH